ncbi:MAG: PAS domain S-box protein, partial [Bacteroidales bacterium]|nr:PAS domain S-box protein [Bacteroidales bacterium]
MSDTFFDNFPDKNMSELKSRINRLEKILEIQQRFALLSGFLDDDLSLKSFLDQLAEGLLLVDQQGNIVLANKKAENMFGFGHTQLCGRHINELIPNRFHMGHDSSIINYFQTPRHRSMGQAQNLIASRNDGSEFPADISLSY